MIQKYRYFSLRRVGFIVLAIGAIMIGAWLTWLQPEPRFDPALTDPSAPPRVQAAPKLSVAPKATLTPNKPKRHCSRGRRIFAPTEVVVPGTGSRDVQSLAPEDDGTAPAPTGLDPSVFAWDNTSAKARGGGSLILTAHTYPGDTNALGNQLIRQLKPGEMLRVRGTNGVACYRVQERRFVPLASKEAAQDALNKMYVDQSHKLVIYVCDGLRRGPGDWSARTVWFATPVK